ncbi:MAG: pyridoxal 5'-phosphate synthase glutaminase subunit PdxT, partial [Candidatus Eisenbacteria bacterium]
MSDELRIGVLALQGDFAAHAEALRRAGNCSVREIRRREELALCDALVLPGGESTTLLKLLKEMDLWEPIRRLPQEGKAVFGTCAGLILMATRVLDPPQDSLGLLPVTVARNAYGRQVDSCVIPGVVRIPADVSPHEIRSAGGAVSDSNTFATEFVFIRAPRIVAVDEGVEVLAERDGDPVLVRAGFLMAASFHPEAASDGGVERLFLALARRARMAAGAATDVPAATLGAPGPP